MDLDELNRLLDEMAGPRPPLPWISRDRMLDDILASRTHVRVLRVLAALSDDLNLSARDVARRAGASHGRVLEVLRHLTALGMVTAHRTPTHAIYRMREEHPLHGAVRALFQQEARLDDASR